MLPSTPPLFFNVTWKEHKHGQRKITIPKREPLKEMLDKNIDGLTVVPTVESWRSTIPQGDAIQFPQYGTHAVTAACNINVASTNPGGQNADVTDLLGMEPAPKATPKYKAPLASIGFVPCTTAKAPPPISEVDLMSFVEALSQHLIPMQLNTNNAARRTVEIPFVPPEDMHMTQMPVRPPLHIVLQFFDANENV